MHSRGNVTQCARRNVYTTPVYGVIYYPWYESHAVVVTDYGATRWAVGEPQRCSPALSATFWTQPRSQISASQTLPVAIRSLTEKIRRLQTIAEVTDRWFYHNFSISWIGNWPTVPYKNLSIKKLYGVFSVITWDIFKFNVNKSLDRNGFIFIHILYWYNRYIILYFSVNKRIIQWNSILLYYSAFYIYNIICFSKREKYDLHFIVSVIQNNFVIQIY